MEEFSLSPFNFYIFLQKCRTPPDGSVVVLYDVAIKPSRNVISINDYCNSIVCFRIYFCQLVNNAIKYFPIVESYTLTFINNKGNVSKLTLAAFDEIAEDGNPSMGKIETLDSIYYMSLHEIKDLYVANYGEPNLDTILPLLVILYMDSEEPKVKTSYVLNKKMINSDTRKL
jgi:hypothetical protein